MRRQAVFFSDDITVAEIVAMAADHGFVVRFTNGATVVDRVPNWLREDPPVTNIMPMPKRKRA